MTQSKDQARGKPKAEEKPVNAKQAPPEVAEPTEAKAVLPAQAAVAAPQKAEAAPDKPSAPPQAPPAETAQSAEEVAPPTAAKPEEAAPAEVVKPAEKKEEEGATGRPHKPIEPSEAHVLVVEDNVPNFVLIARMLAYMGVPRCEWKTSGWQVVEYADTLPRIDLILMDIRLPYEDGFQALQKLRAHPRLKDTLVVAVTAEASVEQMKRAKEAGFDGFLGKPLDPDRFPDQIRRLMRGEPVWEIS